SLINNRPPRINGDGQHSRDFTFVENAIRANVLALFTKDSEAVNEVYNIACGQKTTLLELFEILRNEAGSSLNPEFGPERSGDVRHSLADISKGRKLLGYETSISIQAGLKRTFEWYKKSFVEMPS